ncbi:MAG: alkaline phosphatase [Cytophagales bacterium]|nr:alkaline phosphatase [Cytophagales bacterium]
MKVILFFIQLIWAIHAFGQPHSSSTIFAHNDYVQPIPFFNAYRNQVGHIEADIFLEKGKLLVAHTRAELNSKNTLDSLYLRPLRAKVNANGGYAYANKQLALTLMIDLKSEGSNTLIALVKLLQGYPDLIAAQQLSFVISGNVPDPGTWNQFPNFINFDGRPGVRYSPDQLKRVRLISDSFSNYSKWNGKGVLPQDEHKKISLIIKDVHAAGKKFRFWGAPDFANVWLQLMELEVDIIGTDHVDELTPFIETLPKRSYTNKAPHVVYTPLHSHNRTAKPKNIILLIGDGTGLAQLFSGYTANGGKLSLFGIKDIGFSLTAATDSYITDSAAGATAMASGSKTKNRFVGVDSVGKRLESITDLVKAQNFKTGIISNGDITDATPAAFYAHQPERSWSEAIALDFLNTKNDILIGGGVAAFTKRKDNRDLKTELTRLGYGVYTQFDQIEKVKDQKFVMLDDAVIKQKREGRGDFLTRSLKKTISVFTSSPAPFFIMLEAAQIDWGGHSNDMEYVVTEVLDFDQVIGEALKFVDSNRETLLIVTADHETGGLSLLSGNIQQRSVLGSFSTNDHTPIPVPLFAYGPGSSMFTGVYQNTEIFKKIMDLIAK